MMHAMLFLGPRTPLKMETLPLPSLANPHDVLIRVLACGVCRTDLHIYEGELADPKLPVILGHQIVGEIAAAGGCSSLNPGDRVGVPWLAKSCQACLYCREGREYLCDFPLYTGYTFYGGFAE